jgi:hypothetical protein
MNYYLINKLQRLLQKPPVIIGQHLIREWHRRTDRFMVWYYQKRCQNGSLIITQSRNLDQLWNELGESPYPAFTGRIDIPQHESICPGERLRILQAAQDALDHRINILGSGQVDLGNRIDWHRDYKTGYGWPVTYAFDIDYNNPDLPSDVKFPWELSRLHWLIPVGQAYLLTGDDEYAAQTRHILDDWMAANPYLYGVNWACTMEVAIRIISWTWFFKVFWKSRSWVESGFRRRLLNYLYFHAVYTERYLEYSDVNGNHYLADAAGLVFAGLFFGDRRIAKHWSELGWKILRKELPRQVTVDGVDFEASLAYHRLVQELFLFPALYRRDRGLMVSDEYRERLIAMAHFTAAYTRMNGSVPLWGDADDGRVLPFSHRNINDHRYLVGWAGIVWNTAGLRDAFSGPRDEIFWLLGPDAAGMLPERNEPATVLPSKAFPSGGFYIMRNCRDHIFIDCGPVGLAGRGGHGHNDCLSLEAVLDGVHLISDCGAYLYTASYQERNRFRSTTYHNTPQVDGIEINRFIRPDDLWSLQYEAIPENQYWRTGPDRDVFKGAHQGYQKLNPPVSLERSVILDHDLHKLTVEDNFLGDGVHEITIPFHLAPGVEVLAIEFGSLQLSFENKVFKLSWNNAAHWQITVEAARISPGYGRTEPAIKLVWRSSGIMKSLIVTLEPINGEKR